MSDADNQIGCQPSNNDRDAGLVSYTWDANGNLRDDGENEYTYNHANRLATVNSPSSVIHMAYNGLGDRMQQTVDGETTNYTLDTSTGLSAGLAVGLTQVLADGESTYLYGVKRIGEQGFAGWAYHQSDALGSLRQLTEWNFLTEDIRAFSLSDHRVGYLTDQGELFVKEGELENAWVLIQQDVAAFQVIDNRVAYVDQQGNLYVNEGALQAKFGLLAEGVRAFQLTNVRVGIIDLDDNLRVMAGNLRAAWVWQAENVQSFQLADVRILMQTQTGEFQFKDGNLYQDWEALPDTDLKAVFLNREMPVVVSSDSYLR